MSKEKLRFKIQDTAYGYEGVNTPQARQKDLFEFVAKMKLDSSLAVPTFRQNLPELDATTDAEVMQLFNDAVEKRKKKDAKKSGGTEAAAPPAAPPPPPPAAAAPAADEQPQKLTITYQGKSFSYEGLLSKRQDALCDFLIKQSVAGADACAAYRENFVGTSLSDAAILEVIEERKRARLERKKKDKAEKTEKPAEKTVVAAVEPPKEKKEKKEEKAPVAVAPPPQTQTPSPTSATTPVVSKAADELGKIPEAEKDSIYSFIRGVLDGPSVDIATTLKSAPAPAATASSPRPALESTTASAAAAASHMDDLASTSTRGDKLTVYCQEAGAATSKIIQVTPRTSFEDMLQIVEKKFGKPMCLAFFEGEDKIEIDDDGVLAMFFEQEKGTKLRLMVSPATEKRKQLDDQLTDVAASSQTNAAVAASAAAVAASAASPSTSQIKFHEVRSYSGHSAAIYSCAFSPCGEKFVSASRDKTVRVWNVNDGTHKTMKGGHNGLVLSCDYSPSGDHVVSSSEDHNIKIWNVKDGSKVTSLKGHTDKVYCVQYNTTGAYIVSGSCDRTVRVWSPSNGNCVAELKGHTLPIFSCAFSLTDAGRYVVSGSDDRLIKIWDWREKKDIKSLVGHTGTVWSVRFSHNDQLLVSTSMDHVINVWRVNTGEVLRTMGGHATPIHQAIFTRDDRYILSCARDWTIRVWETETGKEVGIISGHENTVFHIDLRNDSLLSSSLDMKLKLWKVDLLRIA